MILPKKTAKVDQELSLDQRRAYMQLPPEERWKHLATQAAQMVEHYTQGPERTERIAWQGGDIVEP